MISELFNQPIEDVKSYLKENNISSVAAAADTFRAGAIEQLSYHMNNVDIRVIKHEYNSDPASVCFDAIDHAKAKNVNVVLIDTAGRQVTDKNLMTEMQKIIRVAQPDLIMFVGDQYFYLLYHCQIGLKKRYNDLVFRQI